MSISSDGAFEKAWSNGVDSLGGARATILKGMCERRVLSPDGAGFYSVPKPRSFTRNVTQLVTYTRLDKANVGVRWWSAGGAVIEVK